MRVIKVLFVFMLFVLNSRAIMFERMYENLGSFNNPVDIQEYGTNVYVLERLGRIITFARESPQNKNTFLDIVSLVDSGGSEEGLLGLAFHPNFNSNNRFFVYYVAKNEDATILSEFTASGAIQADSSSEKQFIVINQPFSNHNGGQIQFGPDGFLYIAVGDGGSGNDPLNSGQDTNTLLGNILRLNVDQPSAPNLYSIPSSNPFAGGNGGLPEIYVFGLRNPWRFSFDSETGFMWIGDVGQGSFEEVSVSTGPGQNFGWLPMEGCVCTSFCDPSEFVQPIHSYGRSVGRSITGGYVYHGNDIPELENHYIFGDFVTGAIFSLDTKNFFADCGTSSATLATSFSVSTFGIISGDIFLADYNDGFLYKISPDPSTDPSPAPVSPSPEPSESFVSPTPLAVPPPPTNYSNRVTSSNNGRTIEIEWDTDGSFIHFQVSGIAAGWIALGFSIDGSMSSSGSGSDIVMGYLDPQNEGEVNDYFAVSRAQPEIDEQQNIAFTELKEENQLLILKFSRALDTGDAFQDRILDIDQNIFFIWGISDTAPANSDSFSRHLARDSIEVDLDPTNVVSSSSTPLVTPSILPSFSSTGISSTRTPTRTREDNSDLLTSQTSFSSSTESSFSSFSSGSPVESSFASFSFSSTSGSNSPETSSDSLSSNTAGSSNSARVFPLLLVPIVLLLL